ncbi:MAG: oligosaccharide flippase family protein [Methanotrichaceae archaeon]|nr:oligosaccharide flippase family protein [Methanotrichaceae archaeon]
MTLADRISPSRAAFITDVLKLGGGTAIAQALSILASPLLTRLYGPEAFGIQAIFLSITGIFSVIACLRYEFAIMLPREDEEAANLLGLCLLLTTIISALFVPVLWLGQGKLLNLLNAPDLAPYLWLVPLAVFLSGIFVALNFWNSRTGHFGRLSIARVIASVSSTGTALIMGLASYSGGGSLIGAGILGSTVSAVILGGQIWRDEHRIFQGSISPKGIKNGLLRYRRFPIFDTWAALLNSISSQLPVFLLAAFFSSIIVGYYALALWVLLPISLVSSAIMQVFFQRASSAVFKEQLAHFVEEIVSYLVLIGFYPFLLILLFGKDFYIVLFGSQWSEAGVYSQILSFWFLSIFLTSPISVLFSILEKQHIALLVNIILLVTRGGSLILGGILGDVLLALILFSIISTIINMSTLIWLIGKAKGSPRRILFFAAKALVNCIPIFCLIALIKVISLWSEFVLVISIITTLLYYSILLKNTFNKDVSGLLKKKWQ